MTVYSLLFWDSFRSMIFVVMHSETYWFAALDFGSYDLLTITVICFSGALLGIGCSVAIGYALSLTKDRIFTVDEELYRKLSQNSAKYGIYIFLFQMIPFVKVFFFFAGLFRLPLRRLLLVTLAGRAFFYIYYIYIYPQIPPIL